MKYLNLTILAIIVSFILSCTKDPLKNTATADQFYIRRTGADIPVWVYGSNNSKVFIITMHGGPGLGNGLDFRRGVFSEKLEEKYSMVYWDQRAMGSASGKLKKDELSIDDVLDDIHFLMRTLKLKYGNDISFFLMGHSWGGTASTAFMLKENYQDEVNGWINIAGTPDILRQSNFGIDRIIEFAEEHINKGESVKDWKKILHELSAINTDLVPLNKNDKKKHHKQEKKAAALLANKVNTPQYRQNALNASLTSPGPSVLTIFNAPFQLLSSTLWDEYQNLSLTNDLSKITKPTMLVFGKYDINTSPKTGKLLYDNISSTYKTFYEYQFSEHEPFINEPDKFVDNMIQFIELHK